VRGRERLLRSQSAVHQRLLLPGHQAAAIASGQAWSEASRRWPTGDGVRRIFTSSRYALVLARGRAIQQVRSSHDEPERSH
jgi:hypothetical protein